MNPRELSLLAACALVLSGCYIDDPLSSPGDAAIEAQIEARRGQPEALRELLVAMPKGGDLHNHLYGAISAETLIAWGAADGACVSPDEILASVPCEEGSVPLSEALPGTQLYQDTVAAWSIRGFSGDLEARHDHFFDTFEKLAAVIPTARIPAGVAEVASLAAVNHQGYLELQHDFDSASIGTLAQELATPGAAWDEAYLLALREKIVADPTFAAVVEGTRADLAAWPAETAAALGCGAPAGQATKPGCDVDVRWIFSGCRVASREYVFGQWVYAYELAQVAPSLLGVNLVKPEEYAASLQYYDDEMLALGVLSRLNASLPGRAPVHISLHAGELTPTFVDAEDSAHLTYHIRSAVEIAGAERIGHGVDVLGETAGAGVEDLLGVLRDRGVLVEICLTSNAALLGVAGGAHPFSAYRDHGVPVALATDDEAMFASDITTDFVRAVTDQQAGYRDLKEMARASLSYSFLPGAGLWQAGQVNPACQGTALGIDPPSAACAALLETSERARQGWRLERDLLAFEAAVPR